jgi:hypothetical protein
MWVCGIKGVGEFFLEFFIFGTHPLGNLKRKLLYMMLF